MDDAQSCASIARVEDDLFERFFSYYADAAPESDRLYNLFCRCRDEADSAGSSMLRHYSNAIDTSTSGPSGTTLPIGRPTRLSTYWLLARMENERSRLVSGRTFSDR